MLAGVTVSKLLQLRAKLTGVPGIADGRPLWVVADTAGVAFSLILKPCQAGPGIIQALAGILQPIL